MKTYSSILIFFLLFSCQSNKSTDFDFLEGTWKRENKDIYEFWEKENSNLFSGYSYNISDNQKKITETLTIRFIEGQILYEATVPDQNDGKTIEFILNKTIDSLFSFENLDHDFPKKIQYKKITDKKIKVNVLGENNEGFSFIQFKQ